MKKIVPLVILAGISFSAQAEKMYGALGIGTAPDFGTAFTLAGGYEVAKVQAGPKITVPIAAEAGYVNLGSRNVGGGAKTSASGFFGTAVGSYALNDNLTATARLGLTTISVKADVCVFTVCNTGSSTSTGTVVGVGIRYDLKHKAGIPLAVGAEYNEYDGKPIVSGRAQLNF